MALHWQWSDKVGKMTIKNNGKEFDVNIYLGNCLGIFLYEYKENDKDMYQLYFFLNDEEHAKRISENEYNKGKLFSDEVISIEIEDKKETKKLRRVLKKYYKSEMK